MSNKDGNIENQEAVVEAPELNNSDLNISYKDESSTSKVEPLMTDASKAGKKVGVTNTSPSIPTLNFIEPQKILSDGYEEGDTQDDIGLRRSARIRHSTVKNQDFLYHFDGPKLSGRSPTKVHFKMQPKIVTYTEQSLGLDKDDED